MRNRSKEQGCSELGVHGDPYSATQRCVYSRRTENAYLALEETFPFTSSRSGLVFPELGELEFLLFLELGVDCRKLLRILAPKRSARGFQPPSVLTHVCPKSPRKAMIDNDLPSSKRFITCKQTEFVLLWGGQPLGIRSTFRMKDDVSSSTGTTSYLV